MSTSRRFENECASSMVKSFDLSAVERLSTFQRVCYQRFFSWFMSCVLCSLGALYDTFKDPIRDVSGACTCAFYCS